MKKMTAVLICLCLLLSAPTALAASVVTLSDGGIVCDDPGVVIEGSTITFAMPGEYTVSGTLSDGQLVIDCQREGKVTLVLSGVTIHCERGAAIHIKQCSPRAVITLAAGTVNTLSGGKRYDLDNDNEPNGVLFSKDDVTINGEGKLIVEALYMDGIVSKDDVRFKGGDIVIRAERNGVRGKDSVEVFDGRLDITAGNDGIKSTNEKESEKGFIAISGGEIYILCGDDPISAITRLSVTGGLIDAVITPED